ncbi:MAG: heat-inducible transcriptional repressor HrcA [Minwuia sp.]|uniref:heat-inducible transcriptional repressor HrcA n=1 Tax=Minwuia sp. TaxID=2493630 RepID=UPI003A892662
MTDKDAIQSLDARSREIFRYIVEGYLDNGAPVGSRTISRHLTTALSPASVRNTMSDLEELGLLYAPHTSAGRLPTELGLRLFVDGLLELGDLSDGERSSIEARCNTQGRNYTDMLSEASNMLSDLSGYAGLVTVPKSDQPLKHLEFVSLAPGKALVVMVTVGGVVENRLIAVPPGMPPSSLVEASNYLSDRLRGRTLAEARQAILEELEARKAQLDELAAQVVEAGLADWAGGDDAGRLIIRGQGKLLEDVQAIEDLDRVRRLFNDLETKSELLNMLDLAHQGDGVRIFIGSESNLFSLSGSSMIVAPFTDGNQKIVGSIGVIGPTRLNYARIIPMVDYTARVIGRLIG